MSFRGPMALAYLLVAYLAVFVVHSADADNGITPEMSPQERASNGSVTKLIDEYNALTFATKFWLVGSVLFVAGTTLLLAFAAGYFSRGFFFPPSDRSIYSANKDPLTGYDFGNDYGYDYYGGKNGVNRNYGGGLAPENNNNFPNTDDRTKFPDFLDADKFSQYDAEPEPLMSYNPTGKKSAGYVNQRYKQP